MYVPTIVFNISYSKHDALNEYLLELIYAERDWDQKGIVRSNFRGIGGWHSQNNLHMEVAYKPLTDRIKYVGQRVSRELGYHQDKILKIVSMWSIINPPGGANKAHVHPGSH